MRYNKLGSTDLEVSKICLGTMTWGQQNTEAEGHQQLDFALDKGINFIDTAELYSVPANPKTQGRTEEIIGTWLEKRGKRDDVIIATKIAGALPFAKHIRNPLGFKRHMLDEAIEGSLQRLKTDYIDLYQLHWPTRRTNFFGKRGYEHDPNDPWEDNFLDILQSFSAIIASGRVRHWGVSNETPWGVMRILQLAEAHGLPKPVSIQNPYSLLNRTFDTGLAEVCLRENIAVLPYSPLAFGLLSGKFHRGEDRPENRLNQFKNNYPRYRSQQSWDATAKYLEVAAKYGLSATQMALAFVNDRPFVTSNIIGATSIKQLEENIGSIELVLDEQVVADINEVHNLIPNPAP
ncbi:MAG: aldo/keto reductase [Bacteroidota bacterium]